MPTKTIDGRYVIFLDQPEGNAMGIISIVCDWLKQIHGWEEAEPLIKEYRDKAMSGSFEELKQLSIDTVPGLIKFGYSTDYRVTATPVRFENIEEEFE